jgi:hypothetical protein
MFNLRFYSHLVACLTFLSLYFSSSGHSSWSSSDQNLYINRHFLELEHRMVMQNKVKLIKDLRNQEKDLEGCRSLHEGRGGVRAMIACIRFIDREETLGFKSPGTKGLIKDINILCRQLVTIPGNTEKMIVSGTFNNIYRKRWSSCEDLAWQQVYLTAYANFNADPVGTLAFVRSAEINLKGNSPWIDKTLRILYKNPETK